MTNIQPLLRVIFAALFLATAVIAPAAAHAQRARAKGAPPSDPQGESGPSTKAQTSGFGFSLDPNAEKLPTLIKSDSLTIENEKRIFRYLGGVSVVHGEVTLTSNELVGTYSEKNEVEQLDAHGNVVILRGETMRGTAESAHYDAASATVVLTDNPEIQENGSVLTADKITVYLNENRSVAEGEVRVRLIKAQEKA